MGRGAIDLPVVFGAPGGSSRPLSQRDAMTLDEVVVSSRGEV